MLLALTDPATSVTRAVSLLEELQVGFAAHAVAQGAAMRDVLGTTVSPRALGMIVRTILDEHRSQARALTALALAGPGTSTWTTRALELRVTLLDHATREEFMRTSLIDHVSAESRRALASRYATERLRRLVNVAHSGVPASSLN